MHRHHAIFLLTASLGLALFALTLMNRVPQAAVANAAAPKVTHLIYLPLVAKNAACGSGTLVRDGGFEQSTSGTANPYWQFTTNITHTLFDNSTIPQPTPTHSGNWKAWLGGDNLLQQTLTQTLSVPSGAAKLQVSYWWLVNTAEVNPQGFDSVSVQLRNSSGVLLETLHHIYDLDQGTVWAQTTVTATQAYANQTIQLTLRTSTNGINPTSFFIDDVSVTCQ